MSIDLDAARAIVSAVGAIDRELVVVGFPGSALLVAAGEEELAVAPEGFADRGYGLDGHLLPRSAPGALLDRAKAIRQALALASSVRTVCLHSDSPGASDLAQALRIALEAADWTVAPFAASWRVAEIAELDVVGAALIEDGRVLLTRRSARMSMPGKWEFPGGKIEPGESAAAALARECREELGLELEIGARIGRGTAHHDGRRIVLRVYRARRLGGELALVEHEEHGWFGPDELAALDWPEADLPILPSLERALRAN